MDLKPFEDRVAQLTRDAQQAEAVANSLHGQKNEAMHQLQLIKDAIKAALDLSPSVQTPPPGAVTSGGSVAKGEVIAPVEATVENTNVETNNTPAEQST